MENLHETNVFLEDCDPTTTTEICLYTIARNIAFIADKLEFIADKLEEEEHLKSIFDEHRNEVYE